MSKAIEKSVFGPLTAAPEAAPGVTFKLPDGTEHAILLSELSPEMVTRLAVHGLSQKVGDSFAGAAKAENPLTYAREAIVETMKQVRDNAWRVVGVASGPRVTQLARAVARAFGITVEAAVATFTDQEDTLDEEAYKGFVKEVKNDPAVKKALADIRAEDAAAAAASIQGGESKLAGVFGAK